MKLLDELYCYPDVIRNNLTCFQPCIKKIINNERIEFSSWLSLPSCKVSKFMITSSLMNQTLLIDILRIMK